MKALGRMVAGRSHDAYDDQEHKPDQVVGKPRRIRAWHLPRVSRVKVPFLQKDVTNIERAERVERSGRKPRVASNKGHDSATIRSSRPQRMQEEQREPTRSANSGFVDARRLAGVDFVRQTLRQTVGSLGVSSRPKVLAFKARMKERKKLSMRVIMLRSLYAILSVAVLSMLVWLLFFSPVFRLSAKNIEIVGSNEWVSQSTISRIASGQVGKSLFLVSSDEVIQQLNDIPGVMKATVKKQFPQGLYVAVQAQRPAAMLKERQRGKLTAVDARGRVLNTVEHVSIQGIPVIEVNETYRALRNHAVLEALKIVSALPESLRSQVTKVIANTQDSVETVFGAVKRSVVWGDASDLALKKAIVNKIINDPSKIGDKQHLDVSAPMRPIVK